MSFQRCELELRPIVSPQSTVVSPQSRVPRDVKKGFHAFEGRFRSDLMTLGGAKSAGKPDALRTLRAIRCRFAFIAFRLSGLVANTWVTSLMPSPGIVVCSMLDRKHRANKA